MTYACLEDMVAETFDAVSPLEQLSVTEAAQKYVYIRQPGSYVGYWDPTPAPYIVEPQDTLDSMKHTGVVFVGPARSLKSQMALNWTAKIAKTDPSDMMIVHMAQHTARDWSKRELSKVFRDSVRSAEGGSGLADLLRPGRQNDNTFDKSFKSGMNLIVTWPTANNLSGKTVRRSFIMDYDRMVDDVDGEGNVFDLTDKRGESFKMHRMTVAESSPNPDKEITDPKWKGKTPHEAPPIKGIFSLYNRGDRRRWYWQCPQCRHSFMPQFKHLHYPQSDDPMEAAEQVVMVCPHDGFPMEPHMKQELNQGGRWVKDGLIWTPDNTIVPINGMREARSDIASFWMEGPAAAFQGWDKLVLNYLRGEQAYEDTGDETALKKTVTTDQGTYYIPKARLSERLPEDLISKAEDWGSTEDAPTVPHGVRFLIATVDVQARSFVVQVHGFTETDIIVIDGFKIRKSRRFDADGDPMTIDPAAYGEDWDVLIDEVIKRTYRLDDDSGRVMQIKLTGSDSAGREGFTTNAYAFWRRLRDDPERLHRRFVLLKGDGKITAPRVEVTMPDSQSKNKETAARGDVPLLRLNSNMLKDQVSNMLARRVADEGEGGGMIRYPSWMPIWFYQQLTNEIRTAKGLWENPASKRNEAWDLLYYALALAVRPPDLKYHAPWAVIRWERIDWDNPPSWATDWDDNDLVIDTKSEARLISAPKPRRSLKELGDALA